MTPQRLRAVLGETPAPYGDWDDQAVFSSAAGLRPGARPEELAERVRCLDGVTRVQVREDGLLLIDVTEPGEIVTALPALPRSIDPEYAVKFAHARACAVRRWAADLGVPTEPFQPALLDDPYDLAVLRVLAELPSRTESRRPRWESYARTLADAYHDAHEHTRAVPRGDEPVSAAHTARLRLAAAVQDVLAALSAGPLPERM